MRREEPSASSSFLFSLLIFLSVSEIQACSSSCGDITNIRYPFYLKGDSNGCGEQGFELSCQGNKTILELHPGKISGKYYVTKISYEDSIISVVDINLANGSCSLPYNSVSIIDLFDYGFYFRNLISYEDSYARFLNCSTNISDSAYKRLPCFSDQSYNVYVNYGGYYKLISDLPQSSYCSFISKVPILKADVQNPSYEAIVQLLKSGFNLKWSVKCRDCLAAGKYCSVYSEKCYKYFDGDFVLFYIARISEYLILPVVIIGRFILAVVLALFIIHKWRTTWKKEDKLELLLQNQQSWMPKRYSYAEIIAMTNNFKDKLGQGGCGSVYKGQLYTGFLIAVKLLENSKFSVEEFINEVSTIGRIHHVNVVQLVGFCFEDSKRALVYEYMPNGSLDKHIFSKGGETQSFSWEKIHEIALGIARGIEYLHGGCDVCILHFDIKPHNILLDRNFTPKVADFGLAKFYPKEDDFVTISVARGTIGYIAPELISRNFGTISSKSDVYSFGMLLLEMVGGRRNSDMNATRSSKAYFPSWAYDQINMGEDLELCNVTEIEADIARKLCIIGLCCIQMKATDRPSIIKVMEMLKGSVNTLQMPCNPFFSSSEHISIREVQTDSSTEWLGSESLFEEC